MKVNNVKPGEVKQNLLSTLFKKIQQKAADMFEPEEVEVTFEEDHGKRVRYTYTKVSNKQVA